MSVRNKIQLILKPVWVWEDLNETPDSDKNIYDIIWAWSESVWQVSEVSCCADAIKSQKTGREITVWPWENTNIKTRSSNCKGEKKARFKFSLRWTLLRPSSSDRLRPSKNVKRCDQLWIDKQSVTPNVCVILKKKGLDSDYGAFYVQRVAFMNSMHLGFCNESGDLWWLLSSPSSDGVSVVPVTARGAVGVQPVLHVGLLGPLIQSLHVKHVLLHEGVIRSNKWRWKIHKKKKSRKKQKKKKKKEQRKADKCMACCQHLHKWIWICVRGITEPEEWLKAVSPSALNDCVTLQSAPQSAYDHSKRNYRYEWIYTTGGNIFRPSQRWMDAVKAAQRTNAQRERWTLWILHSGSAGQCKCSERTVTTAEGTTVCPTVQNWMRAIQIVIA